ncbi:MAG TPA: AAA family ATPase, partial [Pirellulaceae bacterium]|nr:AAA family ATPase [Pirellulaceae bacterium]
RLAKANQAAAKRRVPTFSASAAVHCDRAVVKDAGARAPGFSVVGQVLTVVGQLRDAAPPGTVVVSDDVRRVVARRFEWSPLGPQQLRGVGRKELYAACAERAVDNSNDDAFASLTPLVGRDLEVGLLQERWEQAQENMGQVVLLIGDAGLGKSRLVQTLKQHVRQAESSGGSLDSSRYGVKSGATVVEWFASPQYQSSCLHPVIDYFERLCGFERDDSDAVKLDKLLEQLTPLQFDGDEPVAIFAGLLSIPLGERFPAPRLDPQRRKERTFELIVEWLRELSVRRPVLFVIEDLHWVDPTTLEFLEGFVPRGLNDSILTVLTFRPEFVTPWQSMAHQTQIALNRLTKRQIGEMVIARAGTESIPQATIDQIIERTDGVPLFVEEFTRMVLEASASSLAEGGADSVSSSGVSSG